VTVVDQSPDTVYSATPGSGAFVEVTLTGALASATLVQYSVEPSGAGFVSFDGTTNAFTVGAVDNPLVFTAKPNIYVKAAANVNVKVLSYQLGGQVST
jgi:hypothetical protein